MSEVDLPFALTDAGYEAIAALVRERRNVQVSQVGRALTAPGFSLTAGEGWTRLRLETDQRNLRASVMAGAVLGGGFLALPAMGVVLDMASHFGTSPWHLAWLIPSILAGSGVGMRALAKRTAVKGRAGHEDVFAGIRALAEEHRLPDTTSTTKVRVEEPGEPNEELEESERVSEKQRDAR